MTVLAPDRPPNEAERQRAVEQEHLLGLPAEPGIDRITRLARDLFGIPIATFTVIDGDRQFFKSNQGLRVCETTRDVSFCGHAILQDDIMVVEDTRADPRFADNPLVTADPRIGFYAGKPVLSEAGLKLGTLCLIGHEPRQFTAKEVSQLGDFVGLLEAVLQNRRLTETQQQLVLELDASKREALLCPMTLAWNRRGFDQVAARELLRARHDRHGIAVVVADIDRFKRINDEFGHAVGDQVIVEFAAILRTAVRAEDVVARVGGEEFVIILPDVAERDLPSIGEKLVGSVRARGIVPGFDQERFTSSFGLAFSTSPDDLSSIDELVKRADAALYASKNSGRDRFTIA